MPVNTSPGRVLRCDGIGLYVECLGSGPPLLILHGFAGSSAAMLELGFALAREHDAATVGMKHGGVGMTFVTGKRLK